MPEDVSDEHEGEVSDSNQIYSQHREKDDHLHQVRAYNAHGYQSSVDSKGSHEDPGQSVTNIAATLCRQKSAVVQEPLPCVGEDGECDRQ